MTDLPLIATVFAIAVLVLLFLWLSIRVVNRGDKLVIYRLGNTDDSLVKGPGLCHGTAGNGYALLALHRRGRAGRHS